jgi:2,3-bisphosphoglycerate-independent phosphoglycerate mutase
MLNSEIKKIAHRPVVLCILDGWGVRAETDHNSIALAKTPNWDRMLSSFPAAHLEASAEEVGLPEGQMGNSEVGHMNLGAGRIVLQDLPRINTAVKSGKIGDNTELLKFIQVLKETGGTCHLMGLLSPGGVHSHSHHISALACIIAAAGVKVDVHTFLDGRDTPPKIAKDYMSELIEAIEDVNNSERIRIVTVSGRYYPMDRDNRWERVERGWRCMVQAEGERADNPIEAINMSYEIGVTDEFVLPTVIGDYEGMQDGDGLLMANFRADRARQLLSALADSKFDGFKRSIKLEFSACLGMIEYSNQLNKLFDSMFPNESPDKVLGQIVSEAGLAQLRIAETEKYAHVTFFLNGGREEIFPNEERILVPSPKVATYDLEPEMSAVGVTDNLVQVIADDTFDLIVVNFANGDMVGHTGDLDAAIKANECLDVCIGRLEESVIKAGGVLVITADHGNCERMLSADGKQPHTAHTLNVVPVVMVNGPRRISGLRSGRLADVAPTLLDIMDLQQPEEMTGRTLII